ncbi:Na+/H+ antiporter subunit E [Propionivibrio sp.]|uniref:Na+/H+ antiporter subunit E n=1 Tax=Propionivibrio sp. TaxID=2212460 RepID=UPI003BF2024C
MLNRLIPRPVLSLTVLLLWIAITNAASLGLLLLGGVLAVLIPRLTDPFWPKAPRLVHPLRALRFLGMFVLDIVVANWDVARRVIGPLDKLSPALVEIPLDLRDPFLVALLGSIVSLTPGTVSIDIDEKHWVLLVHALDAPDPQALIEEIKNRYEAALKEMFAC